MSLSPYTKARRGWPLYAQILRKLADRQMTTAQIAGDMGIVLNSMYRIVRKLHALKVIKAVDWVPSANGRGPKIARWSFGGCSVDKPQPACKTTGLPAKHALLRRPHGAQTELMAFSAMVKAMLTEPHSVRDLVESTGNSLQQTGRFLRHCRSLGLVYRAEWQQRMHGGAPAPLYMIGIDKRDKERPRPQARIVVERRYRKAVAAKRMQLQITHALASNASVFTLAQAA